jgi:hypothetical protein
MRTMYTLYWLLIAGGLAFWIAVGLVVDCDASRSRTGSRSSSPSSSS